MIGRAPILLRALPYSNSPLPLLLLASTPRNPPSLLFLPPPASFLLSKCRQISGFTPSTHNALGAATRLQLWQAESARGAPLLSSKLQTGSLPPLAPAAAAAAAAAGCGRHGNSSRPDPTPSPPISSFSLAAHTRSYALSLPLSHKRRPYPPPAPPLLLLSFFLCATGCLSFKLDLDSAGGAMSATPHV